MNDPEIISAGGALYRDFVKGRVGFTSGLNIFINGKAMRNRPG